MNLKTISICLLGIVMMLASIWIGSWAAHEFAGTWMLQPIVVTSIIVFSVGTIIFVAAVIAVVFGDDNG